MTLDRKRRFPAQAATTSTDASERLFDAGGPPPSGSATVSAAPVA
jgi:hypothetical protein